MKNRELIDINDRFGAHNYGPLEVVLVRGEGVWMFDIEGKKYLDMLSTYSALSFGHGNERIKRAAVAQLDKLTLCSRAFYSEELALFSRELAELCGMEMVLPMNSGAEAVETALKLARRWGYQKKGVPEDRAEIIAFDGNFHGRTITIVSFSTSSETRDHYGPYTPGFKVVPFGDLAAVRAAITPNTVGILVEPIQGEGGVIVPPRGFLKGLRDICTSSKTLLLADEIQTGLCRTGKVFCFEWEGVAPDVYILGKALGGGVTPISAAVSSREIMGVFTPGTHGSTFGGNPFACAIAREVLKIIREEQPEKRAFEAGEYLKAGIRKIGSEKFREIRGTGLMIGVDIDERYGPAKDYCKQLLKEGLLCKDTRKQTIRFAPPLTITNAELDYALERISRVFG